MAEVPRWTERSQPECSWWVLDSMLWLWQFYLSAWVIRKKYVELVRHVNLCIHNSENYMFLWVVLLSCAWVIRKKYVELVRHVNLCIHNSENYMFLWVVLLSCILTLVYQLIVKSMRAFVYRCLLLLWSVKPFYSRMTRRNKLQYLIHYPGLGQSSCAPQIRILIQFLFCSTLGSYHLYIKIIMGIAHHPEKQTPVPCTFPGLGPISCTPQIKTLIQFFFCSTLEYYLSLYRDCYRNCTPSYELLVQWYFSPSLVIPRPSCWCNRNTDKWIVMCEINTPSNLVAW